MLRIEMTNALRHNLGTTLRERPPLLLVNVLLHKVKKVTPVLMLEMAISSTCCNIYFVISQDCSQIYIYPRVSSVMMHVKVVSLEQKPR